MSDSGENGQEYEARITVSASLKGTLTTKQVKVPLRIGGAKGFDILLQPTQQGVFFLRTFSDGVGELTYWGAVARFEESYFR